MKAWRDTPGALCCSKPDFSCGAIRLVFKRYCKASGHWASWSTKKHIVPSALQWKLCTLLWRVMQWQCALTSLHGNALQWGRYAEQCNAMQWGRWTERDMSDGFNLGLGRASSFEIYLSFYSILSVSVFVFTVMFAGSWSDRISLNSPLENL